MMRLLLGMSLLFFPFVNRCMGPRVCATHVQRASVCRAPVRWVVASPIEAVEGRRQNRLERREERRGQDSPNFNSRGGGSVTPDIVTPEATATVQATVPAQPRLKVGDKILDPDSVVVWVIDGVTPDGNASTRHQQIVPRDSLTALPAIANEPQPPQRAAATKSYHLEQRCQNGVCSQVWVADGPASPVSAAAAASNPVGGPFVLPTYRVPMLRRQ